MNWPTIIGWALAAVVAVAATWDHVAREREWRQRYDRLARLSAKRIRQWRRRSARSALARHEAAARAIEAEGRVAELEAQNRRLRRRRAQARRAGPAQELADTGLPGEVLQAIARAPAQGVHRDNLVSYAENRLIALGWPEKEGAVHLVAQEIEAGAEGPEVDEDFEVG